jgi:hypothetical protein
LRRDVRVYRKGTTRRVTAVTHRVTVFLIPKKGLLAVGRTDPHASIIMRGDWRAAFRRHFRDAPPMDNEKQFPLVW